mgnify:CR=1 FL=1
MSLSEFELIDRFFKSRMTGDLHSAVRLGIGDDAAIMNGRAGQPMCVCTDVLVSGVHFPARAVPAEIGQRALRVNLSDLAAMGARPVCFTLGLTLPSADEQWLSEFSSGLLGAAEQFGCSLVGGDTTRGPLSISITAIGEVPSGEPVRRSGAKPGDVLYVTGCLGDGQVALHHLDFDAAESTAHQSALAVAGHKSARKNLTPEDNAYLHRRFFRPEPRLAFADLARNLMSSAIDVSDGLHADAGHLAKTSAVKLRINLDQLPFSKSVLRLTSEAERVNAALYGGDDYELCFTAETAYRGQIDAVAASAGLRVTEIGEVEYGSGIGLFDRGVAAPANHQRGFDHFSRVETR